MQEELKKLRVKIDGLAQLTEQLKSPKTNLWSRHYTNFKEVNNSIDSLYLAKAWLGKMLEELQPKGKTVLIVEEKKQAEHYIKIKNLKKEDYIIALSEEDCKGQFISDYVYISISDKFYIQIRKATKISNIDAAIHMYITNICNYVGTPYAKDGKRKTVDDIEPTADKSLPIEMKVQINETKPLGASVRELNDIEKIDKIRQEIKKVIIFISNIGSPPNKPMLNREISIARTNAYTHLCEARFWLGFELQRIKNLKDE